MGVGTKEDFSGFGKPFFCKGNVTDPLIPVGTHIIKVWQILLCREGTEDVHISVGIFVFCKDVVVWNNDKFLDRKSTRLNSSHVAISYAVFCLKKKRRSDI